MSQLLANDHKLRHTGRKQSPRCGLLPLPMSGQANVFYLTPSLARDSTPQRNMLMEHGRVALCTCTRELASVRTFVKRQDAYCRLDSNQYLLIISETFQPVKLNCRNGGKIYLLLASLMVASEGVEPPLKDYDSPVLPLN